MIQALENKQRRQHKSPKAIYIDKLRNHLFVVLKLHKNEVLLAIYVNIYYNLIIKLLTPFYIRSETIK